MRRSRRPRFAVAGAALLLALGCENMRAEQLLRQATELGAQGKWPEAVHYYERLVVQFPESPLADDARLAAARIYAGPEDKPRSAEDAYRQIVVQGRNERMRAVAVQELIDLYAAGDDGADRAAEIVEIYRQRSRDALGLREAALKLAEIDLDHGLLFQAIQEAEPYLDHTDAGVRARAALITAQAQEFGRNPLAARERYRAAAAAAAAGSPQWLTAMEGLARTYEAHGELGPALDVLDQLAPQHPNAEAIARWRRAVEERRQEMNR